MNGLTRALAGMLALPLLAFAGTTLADPAGTPAPASSSSAGRASIDARREEALTHFELGVAHLDRSEWSAALAEFLQAREIYPTRSATKNAAICLRKENRFDEALDMFEALEGEYPDLSPADRSLAETEITSLKRSVGSLQIQASEPDAAVVVDGRSRGVSPLSTPLRVSAGSHVVRVYKEGFVPFEQHVDLAGEQSVTLGATLVALTRAGRMRVSEQAGKVLDVVVDNVVVGKTPWEGSVTPGPHAVFLRGEGNVGTQPASAPVALDQVTPITLMADALEASARIDPTPGGALVAVDGVAVGRGVWDGRLHAGSHRIEVTAEGFLAARRDVQLVKGDRQDLAIVLERDPTSALWGARSKPHFLVELQGAFVVAPLLGGDLEASCTGSCSAPLPLGASGMLGVAYQLPQGLGFGIQGGYLAFKQNVSDHPGAITGTGLIPGANDLGTLKDTLSFAGLLVGGTFFYHFGDAWPVTLRLGVGAYLPSVNDSRTGDFATTVSKDPPPNTAYSVAYSQSHFSPYLYAAPEVRFGRRLGDHFELNVGVQLLVLAALARPQWLDGDTQVLAGPPGHQGDGLGGFGTESLSGSVVLILAPGIGARYEF